MLAHYVMGHGLEGEALFVIGGTLLTAAGLPRQAVAFAGGYAFGLKTGILLAMVAQILGCVTDFFWARAIARDWVQARLGARLARLDARLSAQPFMTSLTLRLLPVGNNVLLSLLAGLSSVSAPAFLVASAIGYVPQTLVFALLGSGVQVSHTTQIVLAVVLFVLSGRPRPPPHAPLENGAASLKSSGTPARRKASAGLTPSAARLRRDKAPSRFDNLAPVRSVNKA